MSLESRDWLVGPERVPPPPDPAELDVLYSVIGGTQAMTPRFWPVHVLNRALAAAAWLARRYSAQLMVTGVVLLALVIVAWTFPRDIFLFHATWFLHPNEQEHLTISRHLAETGSLTIEDDWYGQSPAHGSEDRGYLDGRLVPRSSIVPYLLYAVPFLISDTAWLWVTPAFGVLAVLLAGWLVRRRTGSRLLGVAAALALATTASVLLNAGGLALENVIALAFLLGGVLLLEMQVERPSLLLGALTGAAFALAAGTRIDLAPAGLLACAYLVVRYVRRRREELVEEGEAAAMLATVATLGGAMALAMAYNTHTYGGPFSSGYGGQAWQGSAGGVTSRFFSFSIDDFFHMSRAFLWDIGRAQTLLLVLGVGWLWWGQRFRPGDVVLLGLCAGLLVLHLGNDSVTGGSRANLVNSPPRYLQPVYATGAILGLEAAHSVFRRLPVARLRWGVAVCLGAILLAAVSVSLHEGYAAKWAIPSAARDSKEFRQVHEFARERPNAVFVGDYNSKAVITGYPLIPRLLQDPAQLGDFVAADLAAGRDVFVVDTPARRDPSNGYYSGYVQTLEAAGLYLALAPDTPGYLEVTLPSWTEGDIASLLAEAIERSSAQLLENPRLVATAGGSLPGWLFNGEAWFLPLTSGGVRVRNTAQYGGIRQLLPSERVAGRTVSAFVAARKAPEDSAEQVLFGLYDGKTLRPLVESYAELTDATRYLVIETTVPADSANLRLVIASGRLDTGDFIVESAAMWRGSVADVLADAEGAQE